MIENQIRVGEDIVEADDHGRVLINGIQIRDMEDIQDVLHILIKALIGVVK